MMAALDLLVRRGLLVQLEQLVQPELTEQLAQQAQQEQVELTELELVMRNRAPGFAQLV